MRVQFSGRGLFSPSALQWAPMRVFHDPNPPITLEDFNLATYTELYNLSANSDIANKVEAACYVVADEIRTESTGTANHANRLIWAKNVWRNPTGIRQPMLRALLGQFNAVTQANILAATDTGIRDAVRLAVDVFADGLDF